MVLSRVILWCGLLEIMFPPSCDFHSAEHCCPVGHIATIEPRPLRLPSFSLPACLLAIELKDSVGAVVPLPSVPSSLIMLSHSDSCRSPTCKIYVMLLLDWMDKRTLWPVDGQLKYMLDGDSWRTDLV